MRSMDMLEYWEKADRLIGSTEGGTMLNGSFDHGSIVVERMFAYAKSEMRILSRFLDTRLYGEFDLINEADTFTSNPGNRLYILIEEIDSLSFLRNPLLARIMGRPNVEFRIVPDELHPTIDMNFALMDDHGIRFEEDKQTPAAVISIQNRPWAAKLRRLFDRLWVRSTEPVIDYDGLMNKFIKIPA